MFVNGRFTGIAGHSRSGIAVLNTHDGELDPASTPCPTARSTPCSRSARASTSAGRSPRSPAAAAPASRRSTSRPASSIPASARRRTATSTTSRRTARGCSSPGTSRRSPALQQRRRVARPGHGRGEPGVPAVPRQGRLHARDGRTEALHRRRVHQGQRAAAQQARGGRHGHRRRRPGFDPDPDNDVYALAVAGGRLIAGGKFTSAPRTKVNHLAAVNAATGVPLTTWGAAPTATWRALAVADGRVFAGGSFRTPTARRAAASQASTSRPAR